MWWRAVPVVSMVDVFMCIASSVRGTACIVHAVAVLCTLCVGWGDLRIW